MREEEGCFLDLSSEQPGTGRQHSSLRQEMLAEDQAWGRAGGVGVEGHVQGSAEREAGVLPRKNGYRLPVAAQGTSPFRSLEPESFCLLLNMPFGQDSSSLL